MPDKQAIVIVGNVIDGLTIWGPFTNSEQANAWADGNEDTDLKHEEWLIVSLEPPTLADWMLEDYGSVTAPLVEARDG